VLVCCSDGARADGYVPSSVYTTRTQYRMQRYPTFSVHRHQSNVPSDSGRLLKYINPSCNSEMGSHHDEHCTHQDSSSHLSTAVSSSNVEFHVGDAVGVASSYSEVPLSDRRSHVADDQSRYASTCHSHMSTSRMVNKSHDGCGTTRTMSSNFYSTSSHYSMRSTQTVPDFRQMPGRPSAVTTVTSHSVSTVQHKQNIIEYSKPFESSDVMRYSEKLRRQRLNDSTAVPT